MERQPYSRVRDLLSYSGPARWTAILSGMAAAVFLSTLVLLLGLFVDLLVTRGQLPTFAELSARDQEGAHATWVTLSADERQRSLDAIGLPAQAFASGEAAGKRSAESAWLHSHYTSLLGSDHSELPPLPGRTTTKGLDEWAARHHLTGDPVAAANLENELLWRAVAAHGIEKHVGLAAAFRFRDESPTNPGPTYVVLGDDRRGHGILGLVARHRDTVWGPVLGTFASVCSWTWSGADPNGTYLAGLLVLGVLLVLARAACLIAMNESAARAALEAVTRLRRSLYHHSARQGAMALNGEAVSETGGAFTRQVEAVHESLEYDLTHTYRYLVLVPLMAAIGLAVHFWLALAFILAATLIWAIGGQLRQSFRQKSRTATRVANHRLQLLVESLRHMRLVKAYLMELFNQSRVERQLADYTQAHLRRSRGDTMAKPILVGVGGLAALGLLFLAGRIVLSANLSVAGLVVLVVAFLALYYPVRSQFVGRRVHRHGREAAAAIYELLDRKGDVATYPDASFLPALNRGIEFIDVTVREPGTGRYLLRKVNLKIKAGQKVGIVASSHDEQMALVSLLPRFADPTDGEIKADGQNLKWVTPDSLRAQTGLVLQKSLIFNDTVANNIGCGDPSYTLPQIIEAAKTAHAHQFIQRLPYGYETPIGEFGHALKPGEQFRIALARAILRDPAIYVIEEPLEHLDEDTKDLVDDTFARVLPGKTVVVLPHRMSTLRSCDRIYLLHDGQLVAAGEHRELMAENELYRHLYYLEFNPFAEAAAG